MRTTPRFGASAAASAFVLAWLSGCTTEVKELPPGAKVIDGNATVLLDPPVGSHMKRRVKVSELNEPGISPIAGNKIDSNTDTNVMPMTADQMQSALNGGSGLRGR